MKNTRCYKVEDDKGHLLGLFKEEELALRSIDFCCHKVGKPTHEYQYDGSWVSRLPNGQIVLTSITTLYGEVIHL